MGGVFTACGCGPARWVTRGDASPGYPRHTRARDVYIQITCQRLSLLAKSGEWLVPWFAGCQRGLRMSGRRSRAKGVRTERCIVNALKASGIAAVRVVGGRFASDIVLPLMGRDLCVEVKARADGFRELYSWLNQRDVLIVKADRQEPLVVVRMSLAAEIARQAAAQ